MKKWKTLKVLLGVLCAMLAAIGLFACKKGSDGIASVTLRGTSSLTYTDSDTWDSIVASLEKKVTASCRPKKGETYTVEGKDLAFSSTIKFDANGHCKVGSYTITASPKEKNPSKLSRTATISITHNFPNSGEEVVTCKYASCGATKTSVEENSIIHYGTFHSGTDNEVPSAVFGSDGTNGKVFTNNKQGTTFIKEFGTVTVNGETAEVPTLTVGRLEPGMTITVTGTAQTKWSEWGVVENAYYYFPVIGIADRTLNDPEWQTENGTVKTDTTKYAGGTSVFVRGEGWVLYNGVGNVGSEQIRALGALSANASGDVGNGDSEDRNYGSWENATHTSDEKLPVSFTQGQVPSVDKWVDWVVYSTGSKSDSGSSYVESTPISLTWNYREDKVIELIYDVDGNKLVCMIKVPDSSAGYYDTILHGDYVDMKITSYELIETRTPDEFDATVKNDTYFEGQMFDPSTISATFTYKQTGSQKFPQPIALEDIYATTDETVTENTNWVSMATNPVLAAYKNYKVEVIKGNKAFPYVFAASEITVVRNFIGSVSGADVGSFYNYKTVGELELGTKDGDIILTPKGDVYAQAIPAGATLTGAGENHRYVALNIKALPNAELGETITVEGGVPYSYDKASGNLVLALTSETKSVKITGLNASPTVFDFSKVKGFNVSSTITKITTGNGWYLNNTANTVQVTIEACGEGNSLERIFLGTRPYTPETIVSNTDGKDHTAGGITVKAGAEYKDGVLTMEVEFPAATLANYAARSISVVAGGETDFVYQIDYVPAFIVNDTVDGDYYTFVSGGKIYLAKVAGTENEENALTLNVNEGNDNISLLNLNYKYDAETGSAAFKSRSLTGAEIKVQPVANGKIILIAVDPKLNGVEGDAFGYQLKTDDYSEHYFAVSDNVAVKTPVSTGTPVILNEGSCLEKGLSGTVIETKVGVTDVKFVANPNEFAGEHSTPKDGKVCTLCGAKASRAKFAQTLYLQDNQFIEIDSKYNGTDKNKLTAFYHGPTLRLDVGDSGEWYWFRTDGYIGYNDTGVAADGANVWSSLSPDGDIALRTPAGKIDDKGNSINEKDFVEVLQKGAVFRMYASYQDGTFTLIYRLYRAENAKETGDYGSVYFEFEQRISGLEAQQLKLAFGIDPGLLNTMVGGTGGSAGNMWWYKEPGIIDRNMINDAVDRDGVALTVGNLENHFATVSAMGGNVRTITAEEREESGIDAKYVNSIGVAIRFKDSYSTGNAFGKVYSDAEFKNEVEGAVVEFGDDNAKNGVIFVTILLKENEKPGVYYIDLRNGTGSTKQADIKLDLRAVSTYPTKGTVANSAAIISGGKVEITYTDLPDLADMKVSVNGETADLAASMKNINGVKSATWATEEGNKGKLTLELPAIANLTGIPQYTVSLVKDGDTVVTNVFNLTAAPTSITNGFVRGDDGLYGYAEGSKLYLYLIGEGATGTNYLVFNANNASTNGQLVLPYSLAYSLVGGSVVFTTKSELTNNKVTAAHYELGSFKITQFEIDLSYYGIAANAAYYFDVLTESIENSATYYTVSDTRAVAPTTVEPLGEKKAIVPNSCTTVGSKGYVIGTENSPLGYYGIEIVPSHKYELAPNGNGVFKCSECDAILKSGNATNTAIAASMFEGLDITKKGLSFSFLIKSVEGTNDWAYQILHSYAGINMSLTEIDVWSDHSALGFTGDLAAAAERLNDTHAYPGDYADSGYKSIDWQTAGTYVTIVFNVSTVENTTTVNSLDMYANGVLKIRYSAGNKLRNGSATAGDFVQVFLAAAEKFGVTVAPSGMTIENLVVEIGKVTADNVKTRYELYTAEKDYYPTHTCSGYSSVNDRCEECGALNPNHGDTEKGGLAHSYDSTTHLCVMCGALDPNFDYPEYTTKVPTTEDPLVLGKVGTQDENSWVGYSNNPGWIGKLENGSKIVVTGTQKSLATQPYWSSMCIFVWYGKNVTSGTDVGVCMNHANNDAGQSNYAWRITRGDPVLVGGNDFAALIKEVGADCTMTISWEWVKDSNEFVCVMKLEKGEKSVSVTYTFTQKGDEALADYYNVGIGADHSYASITSIVKTENVTEHDYNAETEHCTICDKLNPNHEHKYVDGVCKYVGCNEQDPEHHHSFANGVCGECGEACKHEDCEFVDGATCEICGGTLHLTENTLTDVTATSTGWNSTMFNGFVVNQGQTGKVYGTQTRALSEGEGASNAWNSLVFEFTQGLTMRTDAYGWTFGDAPLPLINIGTKESKIVKADKSEIVTDWDIVNQILNDCSYEITVDFTGTAPVVTAKFVSNSGDHEGDEYIVVYACAWTGDAQSSVTFQVGPCGAKVGEGNPPATVTESVTATATKSSIYNWTWEND